MPTINYSLPGADGPLASLELGAKYDTTYFPSDLSEAPYFIIFRANKRYKVSQLADVKVNYTTQETEFGTERATADGFFNKVGAGLKAIGGFAQKLEGLGFDISQPAHSFALPVPTNLNTSYNARYNNAAELGPLGDFARTTAENLGGSGSLVSDIVSAVEKQNLGAADLKGGLADLATQALQSGAATSALLGAVATGGATGALLGAAVGGLGQGALRGLGIATNPHIANVFEGVNFRTHQFSYKFVAKNKQESDTIRDLIRNFKYHMAPDYNYKNHVFNYPSQFQIILRAGDYLFKIGDSVLTNFDVNYTGEGGAHFFEETNAPYSVTINMTFVEDTIVTKKEIRQGR
jgi:hypothetical protein